MRTRWFNGLTLLCFSMLTLVVVGLTFVWAGRMLTDSEMMRIRGGSGQPPVSRPKIDGVFCGENVTHYVALGTSLSFGGSASYDPDGEDITEYRWDFDDGSAYSYSCNTNHTYSNHGNYQPILRVRDEIAPQLYGDAHGYVTVFKVDVTSVTPPNDDVSFTTSGSEDDIDCLADIKPDSLDATYNSQIEWEIEDNPDVTGNSGNPSDPQTGNDVDLTVTAPAASDGRSFKLNYRIRASLTIGGKTHNSDWETIIQDDKDQLRQQYLDMDTGSIQPPSRSSSALKNSSTYTNPGNLTFSECQCNGGSYCGNHAYLLDSTVSSVFQEVRDEHGSAITVSCAYRCPRYNKNIGGVKTSKHIQGHAFDFDNGDAAQNWPVAQSAKDAEISTTKILLYPQSGGGDPKNLKWLEDNGYNATNLPSGWTTYRFGHVSTD